MPKHVFGQFVKIVPDPHRKVYFRQIRSVVISCNAHRQKIVLLKLLETLTFILV